MIGLDYTEPISGAALIANNVRDVFRYITPDTPFYTKSLRQPEVDDLRAHGIRIHLNYETTANFMLGGYNAGVTAAQTARARALELGFTHDDCIIYSADFSASTQDIITCLDFLHGAADADDGIKSRAGGYGEYLFVKAAMDAGFGGWDTTGWSNGLKDPRALAWQSGQQVTINGVVCDINIMNDSIGNGGNMASGTIPASIAAKWTSLAGEFPAGASFDDLTAMIWADAGARYAAEQSDRILSAINSLSSNVAIMNSNIASLTQAINSKSPSGITAQEVAQEFAKLLSAA